MDSKSEAIEVICSLIIVVITIIFTAILITNPGTTGTASRASMDNVTGGHISTYTSRYASNLASHD